MIFRGVEMEVNLIVLLLLVIDLMLLESCGIFGNWLV